jgi:hypothetical protein
LVEKNERRSLKYIRLAAYLAGQPAEIESIRMSIPEIEEVVGETLPTDARLPSWWRNDERKMHSRAWLTAGWEVSRVGGDAEVEFVRSQG